ncbi:MAG: hypothetical protein E7459_00410 [Ruminococcaceae bacterium]|nr:hypothetical protein [Oscillospiraceae bacterium]
MENEELNQTPETETPGQMPPEQPEKRYVPRPKWQLVLAWILLILMVIGVAGYYYWIAYRY